MNTKVGKPPDSIKEHFRYFPTTGEFTNLKTGRVTNPSHCEGYHRVQYLGVRYFVHRLAYWWGTGEWPENVDHRNLDTTDNRLSNLRACTGKQNARNRRYSKSRASYNGVNYYKRNKKWGASITRDGHKYFLGLFESEREAALVYNMKAEILHGSFARFNQVFTDVPVETLDKEYT